MKETSTSSADRPHDLILLVDDEVHALLSYEMLLMAEGAVNVASCRSGKEALEVLSQRKVSLVLLDLVMPEMSGEEVLSIVAREYPELPVIVVTATNEVETAVACMKAGAFDYIVKPVDRAKLMAAVKRASEFRELRFENAFLKKRVLERTLDDPAAFAEIVTQNEQMKSIFRYMESIACTSQPVLITGETGVGKEMIARVLHRLSGREGAFVAENVAGLDDSLFADSLFGHRRGAFTGADRDRGGLVDKASAGTLFLDEIGDLTMSSQVKLLRLVQEHEYYPLGSDLPKFADARLMVATNQDIEALQASGKFRKDLYYRLHLHHIHLPPLRDRRDDIPLLAEFFLDEASRELGKPKPILSHELLAFLSSYGFPGNVRELRAMIFDTFSRDPGGSLSLESFRVGAAKPFPSSQERSRSPGPDPCVFNPFPSLDRLPTLEESEDLLIQEALKRTNGNQTVAAELLGITRQTLHRRLSAKK